MCVIRHNLAKTQRSWCNATKALRCNHTYLMLLRIFGRKFLTEHVSGKSEIFLGHPGHVYHKSLPFRAAGLQRFIQKTMLCTSSVQPKESSQMPIIFASWRICNHSGRRAMWRAFAPVATQLLQNVTQADDVMHDWNFRTIACPPTNQ